VRHTVNENAFLVIRCVAGLHMRIFSNKAQPCSCRVAAKDSRNADRASVGFGTVPHLGAAPVAANLCLARGSSTLLSHSSLPKTERFAHSYDF
jgi:hypothetical protein